MGNIPEKEKKLIDDGSFAKKAMTKTVHRTPMKPDREHEIGSYEINLDRASHALFKDINFNIKPGIIGSLFPSWELWDKNRKLAELQEYTQKAQTTIATLSNIVTAQRDFRGRQDLNYEVNLLKANLAKLARDVDRMEIDNDERLAAMHERSERLEMEKKKLEQQLLMEKEKHDIDMRLKKAEAEAKEAQAAILKKRAEES